LKTIFFLSGLARSGSTLLGSILNQHNQIHVTPTSPTLDLICMLESNFGTLNNQYTFDSESVSRKVITSIFDSSYTHTNKPYIFDKHRGWPRNLSVAQSFIYNEFKGIVTYRPVPEIITSFIKLFDKDPYNFVDAKLTKDRKPINTRNRADYLWRYYMVDPQQSTMYGLQFHRDKLLPLSYDEIVLDTKSALSKIQKFFNISGVADLEISDINNTCAEAHDAAWGVKDLHTIRPRIEKTSNDARQVLGNELYEFYSTFNLKI
jgi:sulfotransferase